MNKPVLLICLAFLTGGLALLSAGCAEEEVEEPEFKEEDLYAVNAYVEELTPVLLEVVPDLKGWKRDPHAEEDIPFEYDEERREWLRGHKETIEAVQDEHLNETFPEKETIERWEVVVVRGDREWLMEGDEVVEALETLNQFSDEMIGTIETILNRSGELDEEQSEEVLAVIERTEPVVAEVREAIFRE